MSEKQFFINELERLGARVQYEKNDYSFNFNKTPYIDLFFAVWLYDEDECVIAIQSKSDEDLCLAYTRFEVYDYDSKLEMYKDVIKTVVAILDLGVSITSKRGVLFQDLIAIYGNGLKAFETSYFRFGNFKLPKKSGLIGVIKAQNA